MPLERLVRGSVMSLTSRTLPTDAKNSSKSLGLILAASCMQNTVRLSRSSGVNSGDFSRRWRLRERFFSRDLERLFERDPLRRRSRLRLLSRERLRLRSRFRSLLRLRLLLLSFFFLLKFKINFKKKNFDFFIYFLPRL